MNKKEWENLKKKVKILKNAAEVLRVEEKDLPRVIDRFMKELNDMSKN